MKLNIIPSLIGVVVAFAVGYDVVGWSVVDSSAYSGCTAHNNCGDFSLFMILLVSIYTGVLYFRLLKR